MTRQNTRADYVRKAELALDAACKCGHAIYDHIVAELREDFSAAEWGRITPVLRRGGCRMCRCPEQHLTEVGL